MARKFSCARNTILFIAALFCGFLIGCSRDKSIITGETKSAEWFLEHPDERREALAICEENNWELKNAPNCEHALNAETVARMQRKRMNN